MQILVEKLHDVVDSFIKEKNMMFRVLHVHILHRVLYPAFNVTY